MKRPPAKLQRAPRGTASRVRAQDLDEMDKAALRGALHSVGDAAKRWLPLQKQGASDVALREAIGREFGLGGGGCGPGRRSQRHWGGKDPRIEIGDSKKKLLKGKELLIAVRELLGIAHRDTKPENTSPDWPTLVAAAQRLGERHGETRLRPLNRAERVKFLRELREDPQIGQAEIVPREQDRLYDLYLVAFKAADEEGADRNPKPEKVRRRDVAGGGMPAQEKGESREAYEQRLLASHPPVTTAYQHATWLAMAYGWIDRARTQQTWGDFHQLAALCWQNAEGDRPSGVAARAPSPDLIRCWYLLGLAGRCCRSELPMGLLRMAVQELAVETINQDLVPGPCPEVEIAPAQMAWLRSADLWPEEERPEAELLSEWQAWRKKRGLSSAPEEAPAWAPWRRQAPNPRQLELHVVDPELELKTARAGLLAVLSRRAAQPIAWQMTVELDPAGLLQEIAQLRGERLVLLGLIEQGAKAEAFADREYEAAEHWAQKWTEGEATIAGLEEQLAKERTRAEAAEKRRDELHAGLDRRMLLAERRRDELWEELKAETARREQAEEERGRLRITVETLENVTTAQSRHIAQLEPLQQQVLSAKEERRDLVRALEEATGQRHWDPADHQVTPELGQDLSLVLAGDELGVLYTAYPGQDWRRALQTLMVRPRTRRCPVCRGGIGEVHACCTRCRQVTATGTKGVMRWFGVRWSTADGHLLSQPWCRHCRSGRPIPSECCTTRGQEVSAHAL